MGNFYLVRRGQPVVNGVKESVSQFSFYMNDFALYFTTQKDNSRLNGYRDVRGSMAFKNMVLESEKTIIKGSCCQAVSNLVFFNLPAFMVNKNKELGGRQLETGLKELVEEQMKEAVFQWDAMTCIQLKDKYQSDLKKPKMAICSMNTNDLAELRSQVTRSIVKTVMLKNGITDYSIVEQSKAESTKGSNDLLNAYKSWTFENWQKWPKECR